MPEPSNFRGTRHHQKGVLQAEARSLSSCSKVSVQVMRKEFQRSNRYADLPGTQAASHARSFQVVCLGHHSAPHRKKLGVAKKTVERKFLRLAARARKIHEQQIEEGLLASSYVFFDEMETFEHSKLKPVSVALAVQGKTGKILDAKVARSHPKRNAKASHKQYPHWTNNSIEARRSVMSTIKRCGRDDLTIATDKHKSYPSLVRSIAPRAKIEQFRRKAFYASYDPLFWLQHICARIRADLSRMRRRTWVTTKKMERLQAHLDLYIAYNNGYVLQDEGSDS